MPDKEYQDKKREYWEEFMRSTDKIITPRDAFFYAFDRAYALGREKDTISQEEIRKAAVEYAEENMWYPGETSYEDDINDMTESFADAFESGANYALGKQEKDVEETPITERLYEEEKSQLECLYYYLNRAADKQENESVSVAILFEAMERLEDMFGVDLLTNGPGKTKPKDADTVISGWVAVDDDGDLFLYRTKPARDEVSGMWMSGECPLDVGINLFPDLTWSDEPQECEIIIKRKKNG